jgi:preprotein translocase subunit SecD
MNHYPLWKNLLILAVILVGLLFALPNLFPQDPSIEVTGTRDAEVTDSSAARSRPPWRTPACR